MATKPLSVGKLGFALLCGLALSATGCQQGPRPNVSDFDTYQVITMGSLRLVTPEGFRVTEEHRGRTIHRIEHLPTTSFVVRYDSAPPRNIRFDADAEKRKMLDAVPGARLTSAQYSELDDRQRIKITVEGVTRRKERLSAIKIMLREGNRTATVRAIGPWADRDAINHEIERIGAAIELGERTAKGG